MQLRIGGCGWRPGLGPLNPPAIAGPQLVVAGLWNG
jgi:hypothetical protein